MLYTTFRLAKENNACKSGYLKFARFKGGIEKWGKDTPFPLTEVLEVCGLMDALWCLQCTTEPCEKEARLLSCEFAKHAFHIFEECFPNNKALRQYEVTCRPYEIARVAAHGAAYMAACKAGGAVGAFYETAYIAAYEIAYEATGKAERQWQVERFLTMLGD